MAYGAEFAVVALIAAAVAASATTAVKVANNDPRVADYDDAFAEWLGSFLPSLAIGAASGGIGAAVGGAAGAGSAAGTAAGDVAGMGPSGMFAGMSSAEIAASGGTAGSVVGSGVAGASSVAGTGVTSASEIGGMTAAEAGDVFLETAASNQAALGPVETTMPATSWYDNIGEVIGNLGKVSPTKYLSNWAGVSDQAYEAYQPFSEVSDIAMGWKEEAYNKQAANRRRIDDWSNRLARGSAFGGTRQFAQRGKMEGINYQIASETDPLKATTSLGNKQDSFSYYDNVYA